MELQGMKYNIPNPYIIHYTSIASPVAIYDIASGIVRSTFKELGLGNVLMYPYYRLIMLTLSTLPSKMQHP